MKRFTLLIFFIVSICGAFAQNISVKSFKSLPMDLTASSLEGKRVDQNGDVAALIKVVTTETGFVFEGGTLGIVDTKQTPGEVWVWVPRAARKITIKHPKLGVLRDYYYPIEIEAERTYEMVLTTAKIETIVKEEVRMQYLAFQISPLNATLVVDEKYWDVEADGSAQEYVNFGTYSWRVEAPNYHSDAGRVTVDDPNNAKIVTVTLQPNFGWIEVAGTGNLKDASVYVDNVLIGRAPCKSDALKSGNHTVRITKKMYATYTETVTVADNETTRLAPTLTADFAEVTLTVDADAEIYVNDERKGIRTWTGQLGSGTYKVECKQANHETSTTTKEITSAMNGQTITLPAPRPIYGALNVESTPNFCKLYIDGKDMGTTPKSIAEILIGQHEIKLTNDGYADYVETISITKGERKQVKATLNDGRDVQFICNVADAHLRVDAVNVGNASGTYKLKDGRHNIKITANGYQDYETVIEVDDDGKFFSIDMQKIGRFVKFVCNAPYSSLEIDGHFVGSASGTYELIDGRHSLKVTAEGYQNYTGKIRVDSSTDNFIIEMLPKSKDEATFMVDGIPFKMKLIKGGSFSMGAVYEDTYDRERNVYNREYSIHGVTVSSFYMGETEVTQSLWELVMGSNPSIFKGDNLPVTNVSWNDCQEFIRKLNQKTGKNFRLPTEAEWEYAARGGKKSNGYRYSGSNTLGSVAWCVDNSGRKSHEVKTKSPNELGLYDMSGNVAEWCQDWYYFYSRGTQTNPTGPSSGTTRVQRGGSFADTEKYLRVSIGTGTPPNYGDWDTGFRLCLPQ